MDIKKELEEQITTLKKVQEKVIGEKLDFFAPHVCELSKQIVEVIKLLQL